MPVPILLRPSARLFDDFLKLPSFVYYSLERSMSVSLKFNRVFARLVVVCGIRLDGVTF